MHEKHFSELAAAARAGDRSALGLLLNDFQPYLRLLADRKLGADLKPKCAASDLVQQTFLDAQKAFARFEGSEPDELRVWLERILLNNLGDVARHFRSVAKRQLECEVSLAVQPERAAELIDPSTPSGTASAREEYERLRQALAQLPEDYRRVIVLRNLERQRFETIAVAMGRSTGAVKKLWGRAILRLKEEMRGHEHP